MQVTLIDQIICFGGLISIICMILYMLYAAAMTPAFIIVSDDNDLLNKQATEACEELDDLIELLSSRHRKKLSWSMEFLEFILDSVMPRLRERMINDVIEAAKCGDYDRPITTVHSERLRLYESSSAIMSCSFIRDYREDQICVDRSPCPVIVHYVSLFIEEEKRKHRAVYVKDVDVDDVDLTPVYPAILTFCGYNSLYSQVDTRLIQDLDQFLVHDINHAQLVKGILSFSNVIKRRKRGKPVL